MHAEATTLALVERIYAAAYDPALWHDYALALCAAADATSMSFIAHTPRDASATIHTELTGTAAEHRAYEAHFWRVDKWREAGAQVGQRTWLSHEQIADDDFAESEFYRDFLRHSDGRLFYFAGGAIEGGGETQIVSGVLRERTRGPFGEAQRQLMQTLAPHLLQAVRIDRRLRQLKRERDAAGALADRMPFGVLMLDARGRVLAMNRAGEAIVLAGDGLAIVGGLAAVRQRDNARLQALIRGAAGGNSGSMALPRPSGRRPYWLLLAPSGGPALQKAARDLWDGTRPAAVLFITDPERQPVVPAVALRQQYGLTAQEARVAVGLSEGRTLAETAAQLGIAKATAETYLKHIMRKLDVHSRAELIALLLRAGVPVIPPD